MKIDGSEQAREHGNGGRTTCSYYTRTARAIVYASTHRAGAACPPVPAFDQGYVWPIYDTYDIYGANADGSNSGRSPTTPGYDAEATIAQGRPHRVHQRARRRHGDLLDERRRLAT